MGIERGKSGFDLRHISWTRKTPGVAPQPDSEGSGFVSASSPSGKLSEIRIDEACRDILTLLLDLANSSEVVEVTFTPTNNHEPRTVFQLRAREVR